MFLSPRRPSFEFSTCFFCDIFSPIFCSSVKLHHRRRLRCRLINREVSFICIHSAAAAAGAARVLILLFLCDVDTVCGFTTEYLDLIHSN